MKPGAATIAAQQPDAFGVFGVIIMIVFVAVLAAFAAIWLRQLIGPPREPSGRILRPRSEKEQDASPDGANYALVLFPDRGENADIHRVSVQNSPDESEIFVTGSGWTVVRAQWIGRSTARIDLYPISRRDSVRQLMLEVDCAHQVATIKGHAPKAAVTVPLAQLDQTLEDIRQELTR